MRYIIGVDLGTTNSCVAYVDLEDPRQSIHLFRIPQLNAQGVLEAKSTLPSFCYLGEGRPLPWRKECDFAVGEFAREEGSRIPTRLASSAKSWLCHSAANRRDRILPLEVEHEKLRISPVEASTRYLNHIREAWNHSMAKGDGELFFEEQDIILTVPASFDEVARTLTVEAARAAGFQKLTLLEEPQAAFYSWLAEHEKHWIEELSCGSTVLVCDVGGGTTDFSLIEVYQNDKGEPSLRRMAVGRHLLLGGDNMDEAAAFEVEKRLFGNIQEHSLSSTQWMQLKHQVRKAKETLLGAGAPDTFSVVLFGEGSKVIGGSKSIAIQQTEMESYLLNSFYGQYNWDEALNLNKGSGLLTMGLPYEAEPSITKHLAAFLKRANLTKGPEFVLFNGGAMKPKIFQEAILSSLRSWFPQSTPQNLSSFHLDLAVARGAAYYGKSKRGLGVRIGGGSARGYYLAVSVQVGDKLETKALTLLPKGSEEGSSYESTQEFTIRPNTPVSFTLYTSHVRLHDQPGDLIVIDPEELQPLPTLCTVLRYGKDKQSDNVPVHFKAVLSPIGTLDMSLKSVNTAHQWELAFQIGSISGPDQVYASSEEVKRMDETFDKEFLNGAIELIVEGFSGKDKIVKLMERLESILESPRQAWSPHVLRGLWPTLLDQITRCKGSADLEARWWNLAGFLLRPGFGYPMDEHRMKQLWKVIVGDLKTPLSPDSQLQRWICFRRIAGGLNRGQQAQCASELTAGLFEGNSSKFLVKGKNEGYRLGEKIRTLAAMELLELPLKIKLGNALVLRVVNGEAAAADYWALGRVIARQLFHGSAVNVIPQNIVTPWVEKLLDAKGINDKDAAFVFTQVIHETNQRELNLSNALRQRIGDRYPQAVITKTQTKASQDQIFGESLPPGLILVN